MQKAIYAVYRAGYTDYSGLDTYSALPIRSAAIDTLEPFLFLNHHGLQTFPANNAGLPFGPHPHKGFETVTFIVAGDLIHKDSTGFTSNIKAGGIQWMTAGSGIIHSELSSDEFKQNGGEVEILQLWVNLPARLKQTPPHYIGLQKEQIPEVVLHDGRVVVHLVSGTWGNEKAPIQSLSDVHLSSLALQPGAEISISIPAERTVLFYVIRGSVQVNGETAVMHDLVEFKKEGTELTVKADEEALLLVGHALPSNEPVVAHGPFVMNTSEEIRQAYVDYQQGKFGVWNG